MERKQGVGYVCINDNLRHILSRQDRKYNAIKTAGLFK